MFVFLTLALLAAIGRMVWELGVSHGWEEARDPTAAIGAAFGQSTVDGFLAGLAFVRRPMAYYMLICGVASAWVVALLGLANGTSPVGRQFWLQLGLGLAVFYFWRRAWWFGISPKVAVPAHSPAKGQVELVILVVVIGVVVAVFLRPLVR